MRMGDPTFRLSAWPALERSNRPEKLEPDWPDWFRHIRTFLVPSRAEVSGISP